MNRIRYIVAAAILAVLAALAPAVVSGTLAATQGQQAGPGGCCP
jgi:hypothetical protein